MKIDGARTWPIATLETDRHTLIGLPQRLGDGVLPTRETYDLFPPLESVVGDDWLSRCLAVLLPRPAVWAWWAPSRREGPGWLAPAAMPAVIALKALDHTLSRRWFWRGMTLVIVPPKRADDQNLVLEWAGVDTEQAPEFIFTAPTSLESWNSKSISDWCLDRSAWRNPDSLAAIPAERIVVLFDGDAYCALLTEQAMSVRQDLSNLATRWGLRVIPGPAELAWPTWTNP